MMIWKQTNALTCQLKMGNKCRLPTAESGCRLDDCPSLVPGTVRVPGTQVPNAAASSAGDPVSHFPFRLACDHPFQVISLFIDIGFSSYYIKPMTVAVPIPESTTDVGTSTTHNNNNNGTALPTLIPPPLVPETLQYRLETGTIAKQGGQRGSLTRCAQKLGIFQTQLLASSPDAEQIESSKQDLLQDLELCQLELYKLILLQRNLDAQVRWNINAEQDRQTEIDTWSQAVQSSQTEAQQAQWTKSCFLEYEALATMIQDHHPQSSRVLTEQLTEMDHQIAELKHEESITQHMVKVRESQFHLFIQYMLDLKRSLNDTDDEERLIDVANQVGNDQTKQDGPSRASRPKGKNDLVDSMDVDDDPDGNDDNGDDNNDNDEDEDGEEGLYSDLI